MGIHEGLEGSMLCAGAITGEQQCLRTAAAVRNIFCDSRVYVLTMSGSTWGRPSALIPPFATPMASLAPRMGMAEKPWTEHPVFLFLRSWENERNLGRGWERGAGLELPVQLLALSATLSQT